MNDRNQKAEKAVVALQAMGIESAGVEGQSVCISPEDAMRMLLITNEDHQKLAARRRKIQTGVLNGIADVKRMVARLETLAEQTPEHCERGDHILDSYATGGRSGHMITHCLVCEHKVEGWD